MPPVALLEIPRLLRSVLLDDVHLERGSGPSGAAKVYLMLHFFCCVHVVLTIAQSDTQQQKQDMRTKSPLTYALLRNYGPYRKHYTFKIG